MDPSEKTVIIDYMNHRGVRGRRMVTPIGKMLHFGTSQWHRTDQWLLEAWDHDRKGERTFAMHDVMSWRPTTET